MKQTLPVLAGVLAGFILAGALFFVVQSPAGKPIVLEPAPTEEPIAVHVIGAVPRPGLYKFPKNSRVQDAIDAAGGLLAEADPNAVNLAALLEDGQQLDIPYQAGHEPANESSGVSQSGEPFTQPQENNTGSQSADLININTATLEELDSLPGIGPTVAQNIIDFREENGPFQQIEDLLNVSGIGPATFENIKDLITV
jgi:competence protein ComEA